MKPESRDNAYLWDMLQAADELFDHYRHTLEKLGAEKSRVVAAQPSDQAATMH